MSRSSISQRYCGGSEAVSPEVTDAKQWRQWEKCTMVRMSPATLSYESPNESARITSAEYVAITALTALTSFSKQALRASLCSCAADTVLPTGCML
ncbi:hypothetical protein HPB50_012333 [Hyalomma asiaticum]|uniref:Uncharacterized protein n=1 Tax=Hyalomma asiaticum TaxID=266040 RepID=A0ACB7RQI9_HYAAI|nr:hypothetical protein HPB50_012333 [Hyalomma asiaticum]